MPGSRRLLMHIVVMGVSGTGKTTVAVQLAEELGCQFIEGDDLHPSRNIAKMKAGTPLTDEDRWPWLQAIAEMVAVRDFEGTSTVVTCSALKRSYRDTLRAQASDLALVYLRGTPQLLAQRMAGRQGHYMPPSLLASQLATLEPPQDDEHALTLDVAHDPQQLVHETLAWLGRSHAA